MKVKERRKRYLKEFGGRKGEGEIELYYNLKSTENVKIFLFA